MAFAFFTLQPISVTISQSAEFFAAAAKLAEVEVGRAQARLDDAERSHSDDDWEGASLICRAEEHLENCESELSNNLRRVEWEAREEWSRRPIPSRPMPTPWLHNLKHWRDIFAHYKLRLNSKT